MPDYEPTPDCLRGLYERLMTMSQEQVDTLLLPLLARLIETNQKRPFGPTDCEYWVLEADRVFSQAGHHDQFTPSAGVLQSRVKLDLCVQP